MVIQKRANFIKKIKNKIKYFFWTKKNIIVKNIEFYNPKERYQADIVLLPNYEWDWFKYIFTMMDYFTKYGWVIPLNHKKAEIILTA